MHMVASDVFGTERYDLLLSEFCFSVGFTLKVHALSLR